MATKRDKQEILQRVVQCFRTGTAAGPFSDSDLTDTDAYAVQYGLIELLKDQGEVVCGHKVALTTQAARAHLGVDEPCFGHILDARVYANGAKVPLAELADPHCEAEIAFMLGEDLKGPGAVEFAGPTHVDPVSVPDPAEFLFVMNWIEIEGRRQRRLDVHQAVVALDRLLRIRH